MQVDKATLTSWADQLQQAHPHVPEGFIDHVLRLYANNPDVFNQVCEEHKLNAIPAKPRDSESMYDTTCCGNDLPWGEQIKD
jgi:hypothetical protein